MIIGHQKKISFFEKAIAADRLGHAYIFCGPKNLGKEGVARWLAGKLLSIEPEKLFRHPDFLQIRAETGGIIAKDDIDSAVNWLFLTSFGGGYKILIVDEAHNTAHGTANAFLKAFEEPPKKSIIILITSQIGKILPTIRSRAAILNFQPVPQDEIRQMLRNQYNREDAKELANLACGRPGRAINMLNETPEKSAEEFYRLFAGPAEGRFAAAAALLGKKDPDAKEKICRKIDLWLEVIRDACFFKYGLPDGAIHAAELLVIQKIAGAKSTSALAELGGRLIKMRALVSSNINIKLMLENLII